MSDKAVNYYVDNSREYFERTKAVNLTPIYSKFLRYLSQGDQILDIGCGSGRDLLFFSKFGYDVQGIDNSLPMVRLAREFSGQKVELRDFKNLDEINNFDAVWACASLVHIKRTEIQNVLHSIYHALRKPGVFYLSLREGEGEGINSDGRYYTYYKAEEVIRYLKLINFKVVEVWSENDALGRGNEVLWLNFIAQKRS